MQFKFTRSLTTLILPFAFTLIIYPVSVSAEGTLSDGSENLGRLFYGY